MPILSEEDRKAVRQHFSAIEDIVPITLTHPLEDPGDTGAILGELAELCDKIKLITVHSRDDDRPVVSVGDHGRVLFLGTPSGYEFNSLLTSIIDAGRRVVRLQPETETFLEELAENLNIMVFVTPTCPHCPGSAVLANRMAAASRKVTSRVIEAQEYPELAREYGVMGVPRTVINGKFHWEGAVGEKNLVASLSRAIAASPDAAVVNLAEFMP
jgi:alkyl hydroperoxide reductase subunit AhpF